MRVMTQRTIPQRDVASALTAFVNQEQLRHVVTGQTIWGREAHRCTGCQSGPVPPPIQPWALERGPTLAVIAGEMRLGQRPVGRPRDRLP